MGDYPEKGIQISFLIKAPAVATVQASYKFVGL